MERKLLGLLVFVFFLNFWFLSIFGGGCDLAAHISWGKRLFSQPLRGFYARNPDVDHLPGYLLMLRVVGWLETKISFLGRYFPQEFIFKLPAVFADLASSLIIFSILKREKPERATLSLPLYLFNVVIFYNSALWGQFEGVVALFLLSTFLAIWQKKPVLAGLSLGFGFLTKPPFLFYFPFFILWALFTFPRFSFFLFLISFVFSFLLPFSLFLKGPFTTLPGFIIERFVFLLNRQPQVSSGAPNLWGLTSYLRVQNDRLPGPFGLAFQDWGLLFLFGFSGVFFILFFLLLKTRRQTLLTKSFLFSLMALAIYLFPTRVHERHLFPLFPFLLLVSLLDPFFSPFYLFYSLIYAVTIAFTLYSPQRGFNLWLGKEVVVLSVANTLGFIFFFFLGTKRLFLPWLYNKNRRKRKR